MKKRFFFDLVTLIAIAAGFFVLLHFQDLGIDFLDNLKGKDKNIETEQSVIQNDEYLHVQKPEEDKHSTMEKQEFVQPEKEELTNCYCYSVLNDEEKQIYDLRYIHKIGVEEIAERLGISRPAASMRLMRLRNKIKDMVYSFDIEKKGG